MRRQLPHSRLDKSPLIRSTSVPLSIRSVTPLISSSRRLLPLFSKSNSTVAPTSTLKTPFITNGPLGLKTPPLRTVTPLPVRPSPVSLPELSTVIALNPNSPVTLSSPPWTVVRLVALPKVFVPANSRTPAPTFSKPELPAPDITPENVVLWLSAPTVSLKPASVIAPSPAMEPTD